MIDSSIFNMTCEKQSEESALDALHKAIKSRGNSKKTFESPNYWFYSELIQKLNQAYGRELSIREAIHIMTCHQNISRLCLKSRRKTVKEALLGISTMCPKEYKSMTEEALALLKSYIGEGEDLIG